MPHAVAVDKFEGPLGLLLELVERNQVEVTAISVAEITAQYLDRLHQIKDQSPESVGEFLELGARLLYIKSLALLPVGTAEADTATELRQLTLELAEYRALRDAAVQLAKRAHQPSWPRPITERLAPAELPMPNVTLTQLADAFTRALNGHQPAPAPTMIRRRLSLETVLDRLRPRLAVGFELQDVLEACQDRDEIIVHFLAILELMRGGLACAVQEEAFGQIRVEAAHA